MIQGTQKPRFSKRKVGFFILTEALMIVLRFYRNDMNEHREFVTLVNNVPYFYNLYIIFICMQIVNNLK